MTKKVNNRDFDSPIILDGSIDIEPQRYVAEKPYDLTRYEYSFLKRNYTGDFHGNLFAGATAGLVVAVLGKAVVSLLSKTTPKIDMWEVVAIIIGLLLSVFFKFVSKSDDDRNKLELNEIIDRHFQESKSRLVHLTGQGRNDEI